MPRIDSESQIVTLINTFSVVPERQKELVDLLDAATRSTVKKFQGFVSASVHASLDGTRVVTYGQWRSEENLRAALRHPDFRPHLLACAEVAEVDPCLYRVCFTEEDQQSSDT